MAPSLIHRTAESFKFIVTFQLAGLDIRSSYYRAESLPVFLLMKPFKCIGTVSSVTCKLFET